MTNKKGSTRSAWKAALLCLFAVLLSCGFQTTTAENASRTQINRSRRHRTGEVRKHGAIQGGKSGSKINVGENNKAKIGEPGAIQEDFDSIPFYIPPQEPRLLTEAPQDYADYVAFNDPWNVARI